MSGSRRRQPMGPGGFMVFAGIVVLVVWLAMLATGAIQ
jgi:hypothetical protein